MQVPKIMPSERLEAAFLFLKAAPFLLGVTGQTRKASQRPLSLQASGRLRTGLKKAEQVWERTAEQVKQEKVFASFWGSG